MTSLHIQVMLLIAANPELARYKRHILSCCRVEKDEIVKQRIQAFLVRMPRLTSLLGPLVTS